VLLHYSRLSEQKDILLIRSIVGTVTGNKTKAKEELLAVARTWMPDADDPF
jgi:hypothetical protein